MAASGRNPAWSRDELILALDLYLRFPGSPPGKSSFEVLELSELLASLAAASASKAGTYRNPNGVYMKMMNFRRFDPNYTSTGKVGLTRGNKLEEVIWDEYSKNPAGLRAAVLEIREAVNANRS